MTVPTHLRHKPILGVNDYDRIDGPYENDTDAWAISLGIAQWNEGGDEGEKDISVKVWRSTGDRWSRQSEEVPIHRALDLATLACTAMIYAKNGRKLESTEEFPVSRITGNPAFEKHARMMMEAFERDDKYLKKSLKNLREALERLESV